MHDVLTALQPGVHTSRTQRVQRCRRAECHPFDAEYSFDLLYTLTVV
jgi:hypothetical protein